MPTCKAIGCANVSGRAAPGIRFLSLPQDRNLATLWLVKCGIKTDNEAVFKNAVVCSEHFTQEDFNEDYEYKLGFKKTNRPKLKPNVVPSVFNHVLAKSARPRPASVRRAKQKVG